ncbi:MAG: ATP-binding protein [Thermoguttaceae bacterium]
MGGLELLDRLVALDCPLPVILVSAFADVPATVRALRNGAIIRTDPLRFRQVLVNLVGNAVKFTDRGSVILFVEMILGDQPMLQCDVCDTGIGLTPAQSVNLFRPFSQGDNSTTRRFGGSGLGLAISRSLAEQLGGGLVLVSSQPGVGSPKNSPKAPSSCWRIGPGTGITSSQGRLVPTSESSAMFSRGTGNTCSGCELLVQETFRPRQKPPAVRWNCSAPSATIGFTSHTASSSISWKLGKSLSVRQWPNGPALHLLL